MSNLFKFCSSQKCNRNNQNNQEKQQEKLAQNSFISTLQNNNNKSAFSTQNNSLTFGTHLETKRHMESPKISLKKLKKLNIQLTEQGKTSPQYDNYEMIDGDRLKSPPPKIVITYRPTSFKSPANYQLQHSEGNNYINKPISKKLSNQNKKLQTFLIGSQQTSKKEQFTKQTSKSIRFSNYIEQQRINQAELKNSLSKDNHPVVQGNLKIPQHNRVDFKQNFETSLKHIYTYSAYVSQFKTNKNISLHLVQDLNSKKLTFESDKDITNFSEIQQQFQMNQLKIVNKKNLTFFKEQYKKFVGVRSVMTIKSLQNPSQGSDLDINFMQKKKGYKQKLIS